MNIIFIEPNTVNLKYPNLNMLNQEEILEDAYDLLNIAFECKSTRAHYEHLYKSSHPQWIDNNNQKSQYDDNNLDNFPINMSDICSLNWVEQNWTEPEEQDWGEPVTQDWGEPAAQNWGESVAQNLEEQCDKPLDEGCDKPVKEEYDYPPINWGDPLDYLPKENPEDRIVSWENDKPRGINWNINYEDLMFENIEDIDNRVKDIEKYGRCDINEGGRQNYSYCTGNRTFDCQRLYYCCLDKILEHSIEICNVHLDLSQYVKGGISQALPLFRFECKKGYYKFDLEFSQDVDCHPGILCPKNLKNILNDVDYPTRGWDFPSYHCDFFCHNASEIDLSYFLKLLDSTNYDNFIETNYGHILVLPKLLEDNGFKIKKVKNVIHTKSIQMVEYGGNSHFSIEIEHYDNKNHIEKIYYIIPDISHEELKYRLKITNLEYTGYRYNNNDDKIYYIEYYSIEDIKKLVHSINMFILYDSNKYGFMDKKYNYLLNDSHIKNVVDNIVNKKICSKEELSIKKEKTIVDLVSGPDFHTIICFTPRYRANISIKNKLDELYLYDSYSISFWYDKKKDPSNCYIKIKGGYYDVTYSISKEHECGIPPYTIVDDKTFEFKGSFTECVEAIIIVLMKIKDIISSEHYTNIKKSYTSYTS